MLFAKSLSEKFWRDVVVLVKTDYKARYATYTAVVANLL